MIQKGLGLISVVVLVAAAFAALTVAEVPEHDEEIYVWNVTDDEDDAAPFESCVAEGVCVPAQIDQERAVANTACVLSSPEDGGGAETSPCEALSYEIGNTDTHLFLRWTMATLNFDPDTGDQFTLNFKQDFKGNHPTVEYQNFEFEFTVNIDSHSVAAATAEVPGGEEDWIGDVDLGIDRDAGTLTASLPMDLLETRLNTTRGSLVGEFFRFKSAPTVELVNEHCTQNGGSVPCLQFMQGWTVDEVSLAATAENQVYRVHPYGELVPAVFQDTLSGANVTIDMTNITRPSWENYLFVWNTGAFDGIAVDYEIDVESGKVDLDLVGDLAEDALFNAALEESATGGEELMDLGQDEVLLVLQLSQWFTGNITINLQGIVIEEDDPDNDGGGDNNGGGNNGGGDNETDGDGNQIDDDKNSVPAPAALLVVLAALAALGVYRRRR